MAEIENQDEALQNNDLSTRTNPKKLLHSLKQKHLKKKHLKNSKQYNQVDPDQFLKDFNWGKLSRRY